jgi:hypothetical protein
VVDLGSGGGLDVFLAARKVGPQGQAIGIDMTKVGDLIRIVSFPVLETNTSARI